MLKTFSLYLDINPMEKLELRMYGLVPYNISPIQQGIQFGHAVVEYGQMVKYSNKSLLDQYNDWADNWKTFMIYNGGTSNHSQNRYAWGDRVFDESFVGSMEQNLKTLQENEITVATFYEPDLNDMLSGIVFIVDERVFNKDKYPDFDLRKYYGDVKEKMKEAQDELATNPMDPKFPSIYNLLGSNVRKDWDDWVESIGGRKNLFLRIFLKNFRFA